MCGVLLMVHVSIESMVLEWQMDGQRNTQIHERRTREILVSKPVMGAGVD